MIAKRRDDAQWHFALGCVGGTMVLGWPVVLRAFGEGAEALHIAMSNDRPSVVAGDASALTFLCFAEVFKRRAMSFRFRSPSYLQCVASQRHIQLPGGLGMFAELQAGCGAMDRRAPVWLPGVGNLLGGCVYSGNRSDRIRGASGGLRSNTLFGCHLFSDIGRGRVGGFRSIVVAFSRLQGRFGGKLLRPGASRQPYHAPGCSTSKGDAPDTPCMIFPDRARMGRKRSCNSHCGDGLLGYAFVDPRGAGAQSCIKSLERVCSHPWYCRANTPRWHDARP